MQTRYQLASILLLSAGIASSALAQGTVVFQNSVPGRFVTHVYFDPINSNVSEGNGPNDSPPGNKDWSGCTLLSGSSYLAALRAVPGTGDPFGSARWGSLVARFGTGAEAGIISGGICELPGVPKDAPSATVMMVVWDNSSGLYPYPQWAWDAWTRGTLIPLGYSKPIVLHSVGGNLKPAPYLDGLTSFSITVVPEPSAAALLAIGAVAWGWGRSPGRK
jgi:hypothetical protein